ncbi:MAG: hypothetical protein ACOYOK_11855 [Pseudobdellovibrionaceae bacterium]
MSDTLKDSFFSEDVSDVQMQNILLAVKPALEKNKTLFFRPNRRWVLLWPKDILTAGALTWLTASLAGLWLFKRFSLSPQDSKKKDSLAMILEINQQQDIAMFEQDLDLLAHLDYFDLEDSEFQIIDHWEEDV